MTANESSAKVLVADDNEQNRQLVSATLEAEGYELFMTENGEQALQVFERATPDCVLLDVRMPGMDGFETCKRIRSLPTGKDIPIVFLTALRDVDTFDKAMAVGADDFIMKPVRPTELLVRVQAALRIRRLGEELRDLYGMIRRQRDDLVRVQLQKEMLMAFVVHDLKNPVATMDLLGQLLVRDRSLSADARESAQQIRYSARQLMRLIHNLLDLSKSEEGKLVPKRASVDLPALLTTIRDGFETYARAAGVTVETRVQALTVWADADLLQRVVENLTENALRHAPKGSTVQLMAQSVDHAIELRVTDRGPGIPAEMREKIFERFVQLEGSSGATSRSGRGLGLAFCKLAVEAHDGRIWIEDAEPGACICIRVPNVE